MLKGAAPAAELGFYAEELYGQFGEIVMELVRYCSHSGVPGLPKTTVFHVRAIPIPSKDDVECTLSIPLNGSSKVTRELSFHLLDQIARTAPQYGFPAKEWELLCDHVYANAFSAREMDRRGRLALARLVAQAER